MSMTQQLVKEDYLYRNIVYTGAATGKYAVTGHPARTLDGKSVVFRFLSIHDDLQSALDARNLREAELKAKKAGATK